MSPPAAVSVPWPCGNHCEIHSPHLPELGQVATGWSGWSHPIRGSASQGNTSTHLRSARGSPRIPPSWANKCFLSQINSCLLMGRLFFTQEALSPCMSAGSLRTFGLWKLVVAGFCHLRPGTKLATSKGGKKSCRFTHP